MRAPNRRLGTIFTATLKRCIEEQQNAALAYDLANEYRERDLLGRASQEQREAAYHSDQAMTRLDRLIGVA